MRTRVVALENYACFNSLPLATWIIVYMRFNKCKYWHAFEERGMTARRTESERAAKAMHAARTHMYILLCQIVWAGCLLLRRTLAKFASEIKRFRIHASHTLRISIKILTALALSHSQPKLLWPCDVFSILWIKMMKMSIAMVDTLSSDFQWIACESVLKCLHCHNVTGAWSTKLNNRKYVTLILSSKNSPISLVSRISRVSRCPSSKFENQSPYAHDRFCFDTKEIITWSNIVSN